MRSLRQFRSARRPRRQRDTAGAVWLERVTRTYPAAVWLNPVPEEQWDYTYSIRMIRQMMGERMYPLTLAGLDRAMRELVR